MPCIRACLCHTCSFSSLHKVIHTNAPVALWRGLFCSFLIFIICFFLRPFSAFRFASERNWGWHWDGTSLLTGFSQSSKVLSPLCLYMNYNVLYVVIMFHWERSLITLLPLLLFLVCTCSYLFVITVHVCTCLHVFVRVCTCLYCCTYLHGLGIALQKGFDRTSRAKHGRAKSPPRLLCWVQLGTMFQTCNHERYRKIPSAHRVGFCYERFQNHRTPCAMPL